MSDARVNAFSRLVIRFRVAVLLLGLILSTGSSFYAVKLYKNLRPDLEELLPTSSRSVQDLNEIRSRLKSIDNLAILVFSTDIDASRRFIEDLVQRLKNIPPDLISSIEYRIDREVEFFQKRQALYLSTGELTRVRDYVRDRIRYEKELYNPLNIFSEIEIPEPKLNLNTIQARYSGLAASYARFPNGYYATPNQHRRVILIYKAGSVADTQSLITLKRLIEDSIVELKPKSYASDLMIHYAGNVQDRIEEQEAIFADLGKSTLIVVILVIAVLVLFYRSLRVSSALIVALFMGTVWTMGLAYFLVGSLNANSAFLGSIVMGNGINFGIITAARFVEERRHGKTGSTSLLIAMNQTAAATWTAALAAGLAYGSLIITRFRGFRQFGIIGFSGMILCWIAAFTVLPATLSLLDQRRSLARTAPGEPKAHLFFRVTQLISRHPKKIIFVSFFFTLASIVTLTKISPEIIEADMTKIRSRVSMQRGSGYNARYVNEIFKRYLTPVVILPKTESEANQITQILRDRKKNHQDRGLIASIQRLSDFIPKDQKEKITILREIRKMLTPRIMREISKKDRDLAQRFLTPEAFHPIQVHDLPHLVLDRFTEKDGSVGKMILIEPPLDDRIKGRENLFYFVRMLRESADQVRPGTAVAGSLAVTTDIFESISLDGPKATRYAFLSVFFLVIILFRNIRTISLVLAAQLIGVLWIVGLILAGEIKINFLNFIALPITFGIGVDYAVNVVQRYHQDGRGKILESLRHTGAAVGLCSLTTIIGYGSLLFAQNQAFYSFGLLAVLGEFTCITAALLALPAWIFWIDHKKGYGGRTQKAKPADQEVRQAA